MDAIKIKQFTKKYGQFCAVKDMNITIPKGKIVGFVGKNGAGKSTTLRSMLNMIHITSGRIEILGLDSATQSKKIKELVSYVPSEAAFYDHLTGRQILEFACSFTHTPRSTIQELASYFELDLHKPVSDLSLGNLKKISLIQGFLKHAQLIVLDEPTSGLDPLMQQKFFELLLQEKQKGTTIFLSSHNLNEVEKYCDKVAIIKEGVIVDYFDMRDVKIKHKQIITYTTSDGVQVSQEVNEDINQVIAHLATLSLQSLEIKTKTVEEEFIEYYKEDQTNEK